MKFAGTVFLKDTLQLAGAWIARVEGDVELKEAKEFLGFTPARSEANWVAVVTNPSGDEIAIFGCQIRAIERKK